MGAFETSPWEAGRISTGRPFEFDHVRPQFINFPLGAGLINWALRAV